MKVTRLLIALSILLLGAVLIPYIAFPSERFGWQTYIGVYEPPVEVSIEGFAFVPAAIQVPENTTVRWTNNDSVAHTVTSDPPGLFDSGLLQPGEQFEYHFTDQGSFAYICTLHPSMSGTVRITGDVFQVFLPLVTR